EGPIGPRMQFQGREVIFWSANDYLGLCNHPEVIEADAKAAAEYGMFYPMGARAMSGETDQHLQLERELADFVKKESAYLLNFGYQGMVSTIDALVSRNDVIVYDMDSHACIVDGVRLHSGKRFTYKHNDMESLEKNLQRATKVAEETGGGILVITEGVFGMRGQQGKIKEICELKSKYQFRLLVDDAHGFGTLGKTGAGVGEEQNCNDQIDVYFSTFAKSMAGFGAFLAGDKEIIRYLKFNLRSQIFAKSLTMPMVIGGLKRLELLRSRPEIKAKLWENVEKLQSGLKERGFNIGDTNTCVTPVMMQGTPVEATLLVKDLRENYGIFTSVVVYPVIPKGMILLRLIPTASHTDAEINETLAAFEGIHDKLVSGYYKDQEQKLLQEQGLSFKPI
ncbi:aminotransferase class I/II-fold pyridoxal phosphate-dependent enzyme, partial [Chryseobacterium joostei]